MGIAAVAGLRLKLPTLLVLVRTASRVLYLQAERGEGCGRRVVVCDVITKTLRVEDCPCLVYYASSAHKWFVGTKRTGVDDSKRCLYS